MLFDSKEESFHQKNISNQADDNSDKMTIEFQLVCSCRNMASDNIANENFTLLRN